MPSLTKRRRKPARPLKKAAKTGAKSAGRAMGLQQPWGNEVPLLPVPPAVAPQQPVAPAVQPQVPSLFGLTLPAQPAAPSLFAPGSLPPVMQQPVMRNEPVVPVSQPASEPSDAMVQAWGQALVPPREAAPQVAESVLRTKPVPLLPLPESSVAGLNRNMHDPGTGAFRGRVSLAGLPPDHQPMMSVAMQAEQQAALHPHPWQPSMGHITGTPIANPFAPPPEAPPQPIRMAGSERLVMPGMSDRDARMGGAKMGAERQRREIHPQQGSTPGLYNVAAREPFGEASDKSVGELVRERQSQRTRDWHAAQPSFAERRANRIAQANPFMARRQQMAEIGEMLGGDQQGVPNYGALVMAGRLKPEEAAALQTADVARQRAETERQLGEREVALQEQELALAQSPAGRLQALSQAYADVPFAEWPVEAQQAARLAQQQMLNELSSAQPQQPVGLGSPGPLPSIQPAQPAGPRQPAAPGTAPQAPAVGTPAPLPRVPLAETETADAQKRFRFGENLDEVGYRQFLQSRGYSEAEIEWMVEEARRPTGAQRVRQHAKKRPVTAGLGLAGLMGTLPGAAALNPFTTALAERLTEGLFD